MQQALDLLARATDAGVAADLAAVSIDELGPGILSIQAQLDRWRVIQSRLMLEADRAQIWKASGHRSIADWLAANGKVSKSAANKQKKLGDAMNKSPELSDAVDKGEISPDAAAELLTALNSHHSGDAAELIDACKGATPEQARDAGSTFQELNPPDGQTDSEREHARRQQRGISFSDLGDGMWRVEGKLTAPDALTVKNALSAITGPPTDGDDRSSAQKNADALVMLCDAFAKGEVKGGRERPTIVVMISVDVLEGREPGFGRTSDGTIIPAEIVRRMCTNANVRWLLTSGSVPLDLGRTKRLASNDQYTALIARDGGCRMPDCRMPADWCEVDHVHEWVDQNGPTDLDLLVLWCVFHHHFRHRPDVTLHGDANNLSMTLPDGRTVPLPARGPTSQTTSKAA